jgi:uncharacterized membrane protein YgcG
MTHSNKDELDPNLKKKLETYGEAAPRRDRSAEKRTRDRFMTELNTMFGEDPVSKPSSNSRRSILMIWTSGLNQVKENIAMSLSQRTTMTFVASILVVAVFLFGSGFTAYAASGSLPGDALYPVKTSLENARAGLTTDDAVKASLFLGFAGRRLDEIKSLIAEGRFNQVPQTADQFERDIEKAQEAIRHFAENNPARAAELNAQAANILKGYDDALNALLSSAPLDVQPVIQGAMNASNSAVDSMDNANTNEDNGNDINSNANSNDDNNNVNEDINDDHNGNSNTNGTDDNSNSINNNTNDDHGNDNLNGNTNTNTNTNTNDKHGGDNSNGGGDNGDGGGGGGGGDGGGGGG